MEEKFKLAISLDYQKSILKVVALFLSTISPIILFSILISQGIISPKSIRFELVFPIFIILVFLITIKIAKSDYLIDYLHLNHDAIYCDKIGKINFEDIIRYKTLTVRGFTSYIITLRNGKKIAIGPVNNFSNKAEGVLYDFIELFERKIHDNLILTKS